MSALVKIVGDNWIKLVGLVFAAGVIWARIPSSGDLDRINANLVKILTEQRRTLDRHELDIAARLTRNDVREMLDGPENPWTRSAAVVLPALTECKEQIRDTQRNIADIWKIQGIRRGAK